MTRVTTSLADLGPAARLAAIFPVLGVFLSGRCVRVPLAGSTNSPYPVCRPQGSNRTPPTEVGLQNAAIRVCKQVCCRLWVMGQLRAGYTCVHFAHTYIEPGTDVQPVSMRRLGAV